MSSQKRRPRYFASVASVRAGFRVGRELSNGSRDRDELRAYALGFPLSEWRLTSLPGADVQGLPDEGSAEGSLDRERAAAGPVVSSLRPVPAIPQMAAEEIQHAKSIARPTHVAGPV
jgi:hypothetical protein